MRLVMILTAIFIFIQGCHHGKTKAIPEEDIINSPVSNPPVPRKGKQLRVTLAADNKISVGDKELPAAQLDSLLKIEIDRIRTDIYDTITVVLDADSATDYGMVFRVMRAVKKQHVKVVAQIKSD